nr:RNA-dependent RNA polymerase [Mute swan feces associated partitiviridae I]
MRLSEAEEIIRGLTAPQQDRLLRYQKHLSTDKDPENRNFDANMLEIALKYAKDPSKVQAVRSYLNEIKYTSSKYEYKQIQQQLKRFTMEDVPNFAHNPHFKKAKEDMKKEFSTFNLKPLRYDSKEDIVKNLPRKDTHAGFSYILTGKKLKGEYLEECFNEYWTEYAKAVRIGSFNRPMIIGIRTQASGAFEGEYEMDETGSFKDKSRLVVMVDYIQILGELVFAKPLQNRLSAVEWYAGGANDKVLASRIYSLGSFKQNWCTLDYSKYDQSIPAWLMHEAFDVIRSAFNDNGFDEDLFRVVRNDLIHKVFIDGEGNLIESHKGLPSGSMFTQILGSICNRLMITTYFNSIGAMYYDYRMIIMGDDNIILTNFKFNFDFMATYIFRNFGVEMNSDKVRSGRLFQNHPQFLSRMWTLDGVYRSPKVIITKMLYPERFRDYKRNPDMSPLLILDSYYQTFPVGFRLYFDEHRLVEDTRAQIKTVGIGKWMSGLQRYRALYID